MAAAGILVSASTWAMGSLLLKLGAMLGDEYRLLREVRGDVRLLQDELEAMHAFLLRMSRVEDPDEQAKLRAKAVREMSYEIEDRVDKFMRLVDRPDESGGGGILKLIGDWGNLLTEMKTRRRIAKEVRGIKGQLNQASERYERYKIDESSLEPRNAKVDPRIVAVFRDASELIGIDGLRDDLVKWMSNEDHDSTNGLKVVSIVGYGGLGKTTLANQVYHKLGANFECKAFVSISRNPDMTKILNFIFSQIHNKGEAHTGTRDPQLIINRIREFLKDKRYCIIIDDIWDIPTYKILACSFVENSRGSRVVTTTRIYDVAKSCCSSDGDLVYNIKPLGVHDSKKLFFNRTFGCEEKCPPNLKEASEDILKKCGGLPLAINAISGLLVTRKTKEEWNHVRCSIIGFAQGKNSEVDAMNYILFLSYFDLPLYLRSCLLYLTMFPEDYKIERQRLVHRWISEGFIRGENGEDLAELAETYFHELINRSLIQPVDIGYDGKAPSCRIHDTILDFLIHKAVEENFCTQLRNNLKPCDRIRRLSLMGNEDERIIEQLDLSHARSLGVFGHNQRLPSPSRLKALRVLDICNCRGSGNHHVKEIVKLLQLRYLNISGTRISELPRQIGDLKYLETLNATVAQELSELPESITQLKRLARLFVPNKTKFPDRIANMTNLQELGNVNAFVQSLNFLEELGNLRNLRKLSIVWDTSCILKFDEASCKEKRLVSSLCKLETCKLRFLCITLSLRENDGFVGHLFVPDLSSIREINLYRGKICWITKWLISLVNLEKLSVIREEIELEDLEMLGSIATLVELVLYSGCLGPATITSRGFEQLERLKFNFGVAGLMFEVGAMPNLKKLDLQIYLSKFNPVGTTSNGFDFGIQHLSSLAWLRVTLYCIGARAADVEAAEIAFESMAEAHPNRPKLEMMRLFQGDMLQDDL